MKYDMLAGLMACSFLAGYIVCFAQKHRNVTRLENRIKQLLDQSQRLKGALRAGVDYWAKHQGWSRMQTTQMFMGEWCRRVNHLTEFDNH